MSTAIANPGGKGTRLHCKGGDGDCREDVLEDDEDGRVRGGLRASTTSSGRRRAITPAGRNGFTHVVRRAAWI